MVEHLPRHPKVKGSIPATAVGTGERKIMNKQRCITEDRVSIQGRPGNTKGGKYHYTIDLLFDWFGLVCFANKNKNCQLSYS
jgi:hypothetical protein